MAHLSLYITILEKAATFYPQKVAFKISICKGERDIQGWRDITYEEFYIKLDIVARYWLKTLKLPPGSVVGLWISGMPFSDVLHIFGIMKAGYVPHILNSEITNLEVIRDLFKETGAGAIIYAPPAPVEGLSKYFPCYLAVDAEKISLEDDWDAPISSTKIVNDEDTVLIVHTSGSTSGRPKLVRFKQRWLRINSLKRPSRESHEVYPRVGSFCHVGQLGTSLAYFADTACVVMVPWIDFSAEHIVQMRNECGLTTFIQFTPLFSNTIRYAQKNTQLLKTLQSFPMVLFVGGPLTEAELEWCRNNNLALRTALAMTEVGGVMAQCGKDPSLLCPIKVEGCSYQMVPIESDITSPEHTGTKPRLLELVVLSNSLDCPDSSLCDPHDGHFHTKDLFEEVNPGEYQYRGRLDDMIKMQNARKCDTKYIEDKVYALCQGLVSTCVVVGSGKPAPALIVEPTTSTETTDEEELTNQIGDIITSINRGGYPHERIIPSRILVVSPGELPRTSFKHNVSRAATEVKFKDQIEALYA